MPKKNSKNKKNQGSWSIQIGVILLMSFLLFLDNLRTSDLTIIEYMNQKPIMLLFFLIPLIAFIVVIIKKNTIRGLGKWMLENFMKYLMMFLSIILTTYLVYFVFIMGEPESWFEWFTTIVIISSVFVLFLWLKYFEELSEEKLDVKRVIQVFKYMSVFIGLFFIIAFGGLAFYQYILGASKGLSILGMFQGVLALAAITAGMEKELRGKVRILVGLVGNALFLYFILMFEPVRTELEITESDSLIMYTIYLIIGSIIIFAGFLYGHFAKEDSYIIQMFNKLSTKTK